jgi:hypothetical protein
MSRYLPLLECRLPSTAVSGCTQNRKVTFKYVTYYYNSRSWGSSVGIVSDYRLDDRGSIPVQAKGFSSSPCVQTSFEAHPASCPMGTGGHFPGYRRPGHDADHTTHLVQRSRMSRSYGFNPWRLHGVAGHLYFAYYTGIVWSVKVDGNERSCVEQ